MVAPCRSSKAEEWEGVRVFSCDITEMVISTVCLVNLRELNCMVWLQDGCRIHVLSDFLLDLPANFHNGLREPVDHLKMVESNLNTLSYKH